MPDFGLSAALDPVSPEEPCGPDLQYDGDFIALDTASQEKPEQQYGETIIPAEPPDWKEMARLGKELVSRTKDLRIATHLCRALGVTEGLGGFCAGLAVVRGYVEQFWPGVHPLLDPEDDNDPTERVNVIASLADKTSTIDQLLRAPLVTAPMVGGIGMRDVLIAKGEIPPFADEDPIDASTIEGVFMDIDLEELREITTAANQAHEDSVAIEDTVTDQVGAANAASLENLTNTLRDISAYLTNHLTSRDATQQAEEAAAAAASGEGGAAGGPAGPVFTGDLHSREDVMRALDKICEYYDRYEPSSPLPLLIKRAKRLATKSFMDILEDLTPDGVSQAKLIGGMEAGGGYDQEE